MIHGKVSKKKADNTNLVVLFINNGMVFLFVEVRYKMCGKEIDRTRNIRPTATLKSN